MTKKTIRVKMMNLDMFDFEYVPIFDEYEKVHYSNEGICVVYNNNQYTLGENDVFNVQKDSNFYERVSVNSCLLADELLEGLKQNVEEKYSLLMINNDMVKSTFNEMLTSLAKMNYKNTTFSYIAYGDYSYSEFKKYKESLS